jgi:hypothetical protein
MPDPSAAAEALSLLSELDEALDAIESNSAAEDFVDSVRNSAASMRAWIEENDHATPKQITAIENWIAGAQRWLRDDEDD